MRINIKLLIHAFCYGMIINSLIDIYAWFTYAWQIPSWAVAITWIGFSVILLCTIKGSA